MTEYIDKEAALEASKTVYIECVELDGDEEAYADYIPVVFRKDIEAIPAADVRPVVICENCKHCLKLDEHESWCKVHSPMHLVRPDDWCSRGEERDDG